MNCTDVNAIMDEHRDTRLTVAERGAVDAHLLCCEDCTAAWHAHTELLAITVPAMSPALLDSVLGAIRLRAQPTYGARRGVIVASALLAGAALAAIGVMQLPELTRGDAGPVSTPTRSPPRVTSTPAAVTDNPASTARGAGSLPVDTSVIELSVVPIVRTPPDYPSAAIERGLQGDVTLQYDVTATGAVENVSVLGSTDAVFEEAAATALAQWKYLPRIAAGKRVAAPKQQTVIRFQLDNTPAPGPRRTTPSPEEISREAIFRSSAAAIEVAWERVAADDFRGAELQLDEVRALYGLGVSGAQEGGIWDFYAYLYIVQGNYDRAIDAYETALAAYARGGSPAQASSLALANLYFARHQYDLALRTLLTYKERIKSTPGWRGGTPLLDEFIARLAALGVTEATLPPRR
jgi:TonB family protein